MTETCPICLDPIQNPAWLPCQHKFCRKCLTEWLEQPVPFCGPNSQKHTCPICRERWIQRKEVIITESGSERVRKRQKTKAELDAEEEAYRELLDGAPNDPISLLSDTDDEIIDLTEGQFSLEGCSPYPGRGILSVMHYEESDLDSHCSQCYQHWFVTHGDDIIQHRECINCGVKFMIHMQKEHTRKMASDRYFNRLIEQKQTEERMKKRQQKSGTVSKLKKYFADLRNKKRDSNVKLPAAIGGQSGVPGVAPGVGPSGGGGSG